MQTRRLVADGLRRILGLGILLSFAVLVATLKPTIHAETDPPAPSEAALASYAVENPIAPAKPILAPYVPIPKTHELAAARPSRQPIGDPIRLRLFADQTLKFVAMESEDGLLMNGKPAHGKVMISVREDKVYARDDHRRIVWMRRVTLTSAGESSIDIHRPRAKGRRTRGELRITVRKGGIQIVNVLDLESYLLGTVEPELGSLRLPAEAIKAQIIASRGYVLAVRDRHPHEDYDFCDTAHCQVYGGTVFYPQRFVKIAESVRGQYLTYKGLPAATFFHHSCGGETAAIEDVWPGVSIPYLRRVRDGEHEILDRNASRTEWTFSISRQALRKCLAAAGWIKGKQALDSVGVIRGDASGRAQQILVQSHNPRWVPAAKFRNAVNQFCHREVLLSTMFRVSRQGNLFVFHGRGWGHGVGMCQSGALQMAREGKTYKQILAHYFPGTQLAQLPQSAAGPRFPHRSRFLADLLKKFDL